MEDGMKNIEESYPPQKLYEKRMKQLMEYVLSPLCDTLFTDTTYKSRDAIREK